MYVAIFYAEPGDQDAEYLETANRLRQIATEQYGCLRFVSTSLGDSGLKSKRELTLSYWPDKESIEKWRQNELHSKAKDLGKAKWYKRYMVEVAKVEEVHDPAALAEDL